jgi:hypothetical protein
VDHPVSGVKVWTGAEWKVATPENLKLGVPAGYLGGARWAPWLPTRRGTYYWNLTTEQHSWLSSASFLGTPFAWTLGAGWRKTVGDFMEGNGIAINEFALNLPPSTVPSDARWKFTWSAPMRGAGGSTLTVHQGTGSSTSNPVVAGPTSGGIGWVSTYSPAYDQNGVAGPSIWFDAGSLAPTQWWDVQITELAIVDVNDVPIQWEVPGNLRAFDGVKWVAP